MTNDIMYIYALVDPRDDKTRYVGVTKKPLDRFRAHLRVNPSAKRHGKKRCEWVAELKENSLNPKMVILEESDWDNWENAERWWIRHMREDGCDLLNVNDGGVGPHSVSDETREKLRISHLGIPTGPLSDARSKALIASRQKLTPAQVSEIRVLLATRDDLNTANIGEMYRVTFETINRIAYHDGYSEFTKDDGFQDAIDARKKKWSHSKGGANSVPDETVRLIRELHEAGMRIRVISKIVSVNYSTTVNIIGRRTYKLVK